MLIKSLGFALVLVVCGGSAIAKEAGQAPKFAADSLEAFEPQAAKVRKDMQASGQYSGISATDRGAVEADLDKIGNLLKLKGSASALNDADQVQLLNAQERVNAVLTRNDDGRLVCTYERKTGSNFKEKICLTARQREDIRRTAQQDFARDTQRGDASSTKLGKK